MDSTIYSKTLHTPIYTGIPGEPLADRPRESIGSDNAFKGLLKQKIREESQVPLSKHAIERAMERGMDVSSEKVECLNERIHMAEEEDLKEPLIPLGSTVFVVDAKNNKVVTVVNEGSLKGMASTNIDGTVMIQPVLLETILTPNDGRVGWSKKENWVCQDYYSQQC